METEKIYIGNISNITSVYIEHYEYGGRPGICFKRGDEQFKLKPKEYDKFVDLIKNYNENERSRCG